MADAKPKMRKLRGGYEIRWGPYTTRVWAKKGYNAPVNAEVFLRGKEVAHLLGIRYGGMFNLTHVLPNDGVPQIEGMKACAVVLQSTEMALRKADVTILKGRTNSKFGRFAIERMGYGRVSSGPTHVDVIKNIAEKGPQIPFRVSFPVRKRGRKKARLARRKAMP